MSADTDAESTHTRDRLALGAYVLGSGALSVGGYIVYRRYFARIRSAAFITPDVMKRRATIRARVVSISDADGLRCVSILRLPAERASVYHTPFARLHRVPATTKGEFSCLVPADAGSTTRRDHLHTARRRRCARGASSLTLGLPHRAACALWSAGSAWSSPDFADLVAQPFGPEAMEVRVRAPAPLTGQFLRKLVAGRSVVVDMLRKDQYGRVRSRSSSAS